MSAAGMMKWIAEVSPRFKARMAGVFFLITMLTAAFTELVFSGKLSFAANVAAGLVEVAGMVAVTLLFYDIFKRVNRGLSLLAASINLVGLTFGAFRWNPRGVDITVVFVGLSFLLIGYLIFRSTFLPRILGAPMTIAGLGWLTYVSPPLANHLSPYNLASGILGEGLLMLWLLVMGVNEQRWKEQASAGGPHLSRTP
jgi:hypothetical protein